MSHAVQILTFGDLGLSVIDIDGLILLTKEYGSGFEQQWIQVKQPTDGAVAYHGKFYKELK